VVAARAASASPSSSSTPSSSSAAAAPPTGYSWSWADEQQQQGAPSLPLPALPAAGQFFADAGAALAALEQAAAVALAVAASADDGGQSATTDSIAPLIDAAEWSDRFAAAAPPALFAATASSAPALCGALAAAAALPVPPPPEWLASALLEPLSRAIASQGSDCAGAKELAGALWAASNLPLPMGMGGDGDDSGNSDGNSSNDATADALRSLMSALEPQMQDLFAPDLARVVCAAGALARNAQGGGGGAAAASSSSSSSKSALPSTFASALVDEVTYQVTEFAADFGAYDLARLISGLADLTAVVATEAAAGAGAGAGAAAPASSTPTTDLSFPEQFSRTLMAAVYARTSTIAERGAVDFALAKLNTAQEFAAAVAAAAAGADGGARFARRSLHFDPRWTHEEMSACGWLPRHDRDKRRIIKENWRRTQWTGF
jgi:hypothetical protein